MKKFALFISGILLTAFAATTIACAFSSNMNEKMHGGTALSSISHTEASFSAADSTSACAKHCLKTAGKTPLTALSATLSSPVSSTGKIVMILFVLVQAAGVAIRRRTGSPPWEEAAIAIFSQLKPYKTVVLRD